MRGGSVMRAVLVSPVQSSYDKLNVSAVWLYCEALR